MATLAELGRRLRAKEVSAVELARSALEALRTKGAELNAVAALTEELALSQAKRADEQLRSGVDLGPLHGIPFGAKDLLDTAGIPTEYGSPAHKGRVPSSDAEVISRLAKAGAVLVAKLSMVTLAGGGGYTNGAASSVGPLRNPWDPRRWAGGSSSGSAAAVAAGLVPFALGSETVGSILQPASYCGVTGLRPSFGRVPRTGAMPLASSLDTIGPLAESAEDCATVLAAISGPDGADRGSTLPRYEAGTTRAVKGVRLGVVPENYADFADAEVEPLFNDALAVLERLGATRGSVALPPPAKLKHRPVSTLISVEMAATFRDLIEGEGLNKLTDARQREGLLESLTVPGVDYVEALKFQEQTRAAAAELFKSCDLLVAPTMLRVAPPVAHDLNDWSRGGGRLVGWSCFAGLPAITLPMGFGESGLPLGIQLVGAHGDEQLLVNVARAYQRETSWHTQRPR